MGERREWGGEKRMGRMRKRRGRGENEVGG